MCLTLKWTIICRPVYNHRDQCMSECMWWIERNYTADEDDDARVMKGMQSELITSVHMIAENR